jgi:hypothetical protein
MSETQIPTETPLDKEASLRPSMHNLHSIENAATNLTE